jgi:hypothetical protein
VHLRRAQLALEPPDVGFPHLHPHALPPLQAVVPGAPGGVEAQDAEAGRVDAQQAVLKAVDPHGELAQRPLQAVGVDDDGPPLGRAQDHGVQPHDTRSLRRHHHHLVRGAVPGDPQPHAVSGLEAAREQGEALAGADAVHHRQQVPLADPRVLGGGARPHLQHPHAGLPSRVEHHPDHPRPAAGAVVLGGRARGAASAAASSGSIIRWSFIVPSLPLSCRVA